jgi:predicted restriction endonuclease
VETQIEAMQKKLDIYEKERMDQKQIVETMQQKVDVQQKNIKSMQQKFDVQHKNIESMQQKIGLITILLQNGAGREATSSNDSQCLITEPHKSRDKRKKISKVVRQHVVDKQEKACGMCKLVLTPYFEIDHIIGLQFGGTDDEANLMALCRDCHAKKSITENQRRDKIKDAIQTILSE